MSTKRIDAIRPPDKVIPADRPVAAERSDEIRVRTEVLLQKLGDGGQRRSRGGYVPTPYDDPESAEEENDDEEELKRAAAATRDAFDTPSEERARVLDAL